MLIRIANYPDWLGPSDKFVGKSKKVTCPEITCYRIKYSTVLWHVELQNQTWSKCLDAGTYCK